MSVTIGFGLREQEDHPVVSQIRQIASAYRYGMECGLASLDQDVRDGVANLVKIMGWNWIACLRAPINGQGNLAFGIYEELTRRETEGLEPPFFEFCREVVKAAGLSGVAKLGLFFASEWHAEDRIRMSYGDVERLIQILSLPGHWTVHSLNPETGSMEEWDELPLFFDIDIDLNRTRPTNGIGRANPFEE